MNKKRVTIEGIPAILWGEPTDSLLLVVHGFMSNKEDEGIYQLAEIALNKGIQMLSFDLPEHGERITEKRQCNPPNAVEDLSAILRYTRQKPSKISLFACSLGAYFSLLAYANEKFDKCLFLAPVVDMDVLIRSMMKQAQVSEERLMLEKNIPNPAGPAFSWDYFSYVTSHPITRWNSPTSILMGSEDQTSDPAVVKNFSHRFGCGLSVVEGGGHYLHTPTETLAIQNWIEKEL